MSSSQPTMNGPSQPERLPIELMSAMPPAAALPASSVVGSCQNGENALSTPETPTTSAANASAGVFSKTPISTKPAAAARHESAQWERRSGTRSEVRPTSTSAIIAATYGTADNSPIVVLSVTPMPLMIVGTQN